MEHWNKGGLTREEFLRMREEATRKLQELAKRQTSGPQRPIFASAPPDDPDLQKPKAPLAVPAQEESFKASQPDAFDAVPVKNGGVELPDRQPEKSSPDLSAPEELSGDPVFAAGPSLDPPQPFSAETAVEEFSPVLEDTPGAAPLDEEPDKFMPSEGLLQTIQDISQAMGDPDFSRENPPDTFRPDAKEDPDPIQEPHAPQTVFAEPVFVPPLPYHPDGFIPRKPRRGPSFHPDAVRPEKGCYQPPRPAERLSYHPENQGKAEEPKKK